MCSVALIKKKTKFSSCIRKFRWDCVQSHILGRDSLHMRKCANFSPYMRRPLVIYDFTPDPLNFLIYEENFIFFYYQCGHSIELKSVFFTDSVNCPFISCLALNQLIRVP